MSETLKDLLEYLQNKIDSGEHKIFFNDLGWDVKTIDCINAINEQQEEIEKLKEEKQKLEKIIIEQDEEQRKLFNHIVKDDYKGRIDKAIEYIETKWKKDDYYEDIENCLQFCIFNEFDKEDLLDILRGEE